MNPRTPRPGRGFLSLLTFNLYPFNDLLAFEYKTSGSDSNSERGDFSLPFPGDSSSWGPRLSH
jgi:hypothetical protein